MALSFGTNGVRGTLDQLTPLEAVRFSKAFALWLSKQLGKKPTVVLAHDHRLTSPLLHHACASGLISGGADVTDIGMASSPTAEIMLHKLGCDGAIIVTASHNPPEWNALKFVDWRGVAISHEKGAEISGFLESQGVAFDKIGKIAHLEGASETHKRLVLSNIDAKAFSKRNLKVVIDCANGTAVLVAPYIFSELGCELITLNSHADGHFPGRLSEPTEANLKDLIACVVECKADMGIAFDGDCDRVIFVDEKGTWIVGDKGLAISLAIALEHNARSPKPVKSPVVVSTVATSKAVEGVASKFNATMHFTKVGAPYLSEEMLCTKAFFGGEEVGGIIWPEVSLAKDGFLAAAKVAQAVCSKPLSKYLQELPVYFNSKTKVPADGKAKEKALKFMSGAKVQGAKVTTLDGVRLDFADSSWVIVRASGTENYLRIFAEAKTQKQAQSLMQEYERAVRKTIGQ